MVSSTLCPAVHILGSQNVYGRAEGIADHYWPWAVFFKILKFLFYDTSLITTTQQNHYIHIRFRERAVSHPKFSAENDYDD